MFNLKFNPIASGTIYVLDRYSGQSSKLYYLDLETGKPTFVGEVVPEVFDIEFADDKLYGIAHRVGGQTMQLLRIDPATARATVIGDTRFYTVGLAYNSVRKTLYASTAKELISINPITGVGTPVMTIADSAYNCGELTFSSTGKAYITLIGNDQKKLLATCNLSTGKVTRIGEISYPNLTCMKFYRDMLYGVTGEYLGLSRNGQLIQIDLNTGAGALVRETETAHCWAGMTIYEPVSFSMLPPQVSVSIVSLPADSEVLTFDSFPRNPERDIVCVAPVRTIVRREEEVILTRKIRKIEEIDASPACPINTAQLPSLSLPEPESKAL
ncbi:MAG: hypothetical protein ACRC8A_01190 [Microcoleaceae cyanobacterium]